VPDRLVDGQPQVGRVDDQVVAARLDRGGLGLLAQQLGEFGQLALPVPGVAGEELPAAPHRWGQRAHRLEGAGRPVDGERGELRVQPDALLPGAGARRVGVVLLLLDLHDTALHVLDPVGGQQPLGQLGEQPGLVPVRDGERVDLVGRDPLDVGVHRLGGELDAVGVHRGGHLRHGDRLLGQPDGLGGGEHDPGGETPCALVHDAHGQPQVLPVGQRLEPGVAEPDRLGADALDPQVGVLAAQVDRPGQRRLGERGQRQGEEGLVDGTGL
jgi:hypothetical protein